MSPIINCAFVQDGKLVPIIVYLLLYSLWAQLFFNISLKHHAATTWPWLTGTASVDLMILQVFLNLNDSDCVIQYYEKSELFYLLSHPVFE